MQYLPASRSAQYLNLNRENIKDLNFLNGYILFLIIFISQSLIRYLVSAAAVGKKWRGTVLRYRGISGAVTQALTRATMSPWEQNPYCYVRVRWT